MNETSGFSGCFADFLECFGTDFAEADQLFFDQIRASAENNEKITEAARANSFADFAAYPDRILDELFIARMEGNELKHPLIFAIK